MKADALKIERKEKDSRDVSEMELTGSDNSLDVGSRRGRSQQWLSLLPWVEQ